MRRFSRCAVTGFASLVGVVVHVDRVMVMAVVFRGHCITVNALVMTRARNGTKSGNSLQGYCQQHEACQEDFPERGFHRVIKTQRVAARGMVNRLTTAPASGAF